MGILHLILSGAAVLAILTGCQTMPYQGQARDVKRKPQQEGVISIALDHRPEDRQKAEEKMKSNCGMYPVKILEEGEVAVGQSTQVSGRETERASTKRKAGSLFGIPIVTGEEAGKDTSSSTVTTSVKEWHISYVCEAKRSSAHR